MTEQLEKLKQEVDKVVSERGVVGPVYYDGDEAALILTEDAVIAVTWDGTVSEAPLADEFKNREDGDGAENTD